MQPTLNQYHAEQLFASFFQIARIFYLLHPAIFLASGVNKF